ncbi:MAG TPA: glutamate racemase [Stellaceae bacterium]|nr:glutamate racemase [Stellaceae bacterium]
MPSPHLLIFDSGVGGLTIAAEIAASMPSARLDFLCDNDFFPYGTKAEGLLIERVVEVVGAAVARLLPDLVVIACNSASTVALARLRAEIKVPIVGTVPAVKPAAALSKTKAIGLLGTPGTVKRAYTQDLIDRFASGCAVVRVGSSELVAMAEAKLRDVPCDRARIATILAPFFGPLAQAPIDVVVLACTHFPLLMEELAAAASPGTLWIDSGAAIARRVRALMGEVSDGAPRESRRCVFFTQGNATDPRQIAAFRRFGFSA